MIFLPVHIVKVNKYARSESDVVETLAPVRGIKVLFLWKIATRKSEIAFSFSTDEKSDIYGQILIATQIPYCTLFLSYPGGGRGGTPIHYLQCRDFEAPDLERGIHFTGVF